MVGADAIRAGFRRWEDFLSVRVAEDETPNLTAEPGKRFLLSLGVNPDVLEEIYAQVFDLMRRDFDVEFESPALLLATIAFCAGVASSQEAGLWPG